MKCLICGENTKSYFKDVKTNREYFRCESCNFVFADPASRLSAQEERKRYELHENDVNDHRYQNFVNPMFRWIRDNVPQEAKGLDFGCGEGPVLTHLLTEEGYSIDLYDPFFRNDRSVFNRRYDFIFAVEVVEHFFEPLQEFVNLKQLLKPNGILAVMTSPFSDKVDFKTWYYRQDPTHVSFYSKRTFHVLQQKIAFHTCEMPQDRVAVFKNTSV